MKRFIFRYQKILEMRLDKEEEVKNKLAEANGELSRLIKTRQAVQQSAEVFYESVRQRMIQGITSGDLRMIEQSKQHYKDRLEQLDMQIGDQRLKIAQIKIELGEAMKERKIMEKLREREQEAYYDMLNAQENKQIEEIVNYQSSKKRGEE